MYRQSLLFLKYLQRRKTLWSTVLTVLIAAAIPVWFCIDVALWQARVALREIKEQLQSSPGIVFRMGTVRPNVYRHDHFKAEFSDIRVTVENIRLQVPELAAGLEQRKQSVAQR